MEEENVCKSQPIEIGKGKMMDGKGDQQRQRFVSESGSDDSGFEGLEALEPLDFGVSDFRGFQSQPSRTSMDSGVEEEMSSESGDTTSGAHDQMPDVSFFSIAMQMRLKDKEAKVR